jgi:IS30 family transposase
MRELYFRGVKQHHSPEQITGGLKREKVTQISHETIELFSEISNDRLKTMTFDHGKEFSGHGELSERLRLSCYFATPGNEG